MSSGPSEHPGGEGARPPASSPGPAHNPPRPAAVTETEPERGEKKPRPPGPLAAVRELVVLLVAAFLLALLIKTFLIQAFYIPSESMEPTLDVGDRVLVNKVVYHLHPPRRGDIIVFEDPHPAAEPARNPVSAFLHWLTEGLGATTPREKDFIKRVVALPGETIEIRAGRVFIDGRQLDERYLPTPRPPMPDFGPELVPPNTLFVMGDNRGNSQDSRSSALGVIPYSKVIGRAFVVIWPPSRIGWLHGL
jgi:signal peptidase I